MAAGVRTSSRAALSPRAPRRPSTELRGRRAGQGAGHGESERSGRAAATVRLRGARSHREPAGAHSSRSSSAGAGRGPGLVMVPRGPERPPRRPPRHARGGDWAGRCSCCAATGCSRPEVRAARPPDPAEPCRLVAADLAPGGVPARARPVGACSTAPAGGAADIDTNRKRNLALAAAAMTGQRLGALRRRRRRRSRHGRVDTACAHLHRSPDHRVVGWPSRTSPTTPSSTTPGATSSGGPRTCFVGGGALLVDLAGRRAARFPPVYNEDWLFLFDAARRRRRSCSGRDVGQRQYDAYADPGGPRTRSSATSSPRGCTTCSTSAARRRSPATRTTGATCTRSGASCIGRIVERAARASASGEATRTTLTAALAP